MANLKNNYKKITVVLNEGRNFHFFIHKTLTKAVLKQMLSTILPSTGQNKLYGNLLLYVTSLISVMVGHFDSKHSCLIQKNVPIEFILLSKCQDGADSLQILTTSCLWFDCAACVAHVKKKLRLLARTVLGPAQESHLTFRGC